MLISTKGQYAMRIMIDLAINYTGNAVTVKAIAGAELSYMTIGQNVPDDIAIFDTQKIVKQLLGGNA